MRPVAAYVLEGCMRNVQDQPPFIKREPHVKAVVNIGGEPRLQDNPVPQPGKGQVLIRIHRTAISAGTELYRLAIATPQTVEPLGYVSAGVVEETNETTLRKKGDRVFAFCPHGEYGVANAIQTQLIPEGLDFDAAAASYWAVPALRGIHRLRPRLHDNLAVVGQGAIGLMGLQLLRHIAGTLVAVDVDALRLERSARLGADLCVNARQQDPAKEVGALIREGATGVLEASGTKDGLRVALEIVRPMGVVVALRIHRDLSGLDLNKYMYFKELSLIYSGAGSMPPPDEYLLDRTPLLSGVSTKVYPEEWHVGREIATTMRMASTGYLQTAPIITHEIAPEQMTQAYQALRQPKESSAYLGVIVKWA